MTFELENWWFHRVILCLMETLTGLSTEPCSTPWLCERKRSNRTRTDKSKTDVDVFLQRRSCAATPSTDHYCTHTVTRRICNSWSDAGMFYLSGRFIKDLHKCSCSENRRLQINIWTGSALVHSLMSVYVCVGGRGGAALGSATGTGARRFTVWNLMESGCVLYAFVSVIHYEWSPPSITETKITETEASVASAWTAQLQRNEHALLLFGFIIYSHLGRHARTSKTNLKVKHLIKSSPKKMSVYEFFCFLISANKCGPLQLKIWRRVI